MTCDSSSPCSVFGPLACTGQCSHKDTTTSARGEIDAVSARERRKAKQLLSAMVPLDEWLQASTPEFLACSSFGFASPEAFYNAIRAELLKLAGEQS